MISAIYQFLWGVIELNELRSSRFCIERAVATYNEAVGLRVLHLLRVVYVHSSHYV